MAVNLIGKLPRFKSADGFCFKRSNFLDGTLKTYFGPGQSIDCLFSYYPPTDWRPSGGILTPPQVVWLVLAQPDATTPDYTGYYSYPAILFTQAGSFTGLVPTTSGQEVITENFTYTYSDGSSVTGTVKEVVITPGGGDLTSVFNSALLGTTIKYVFDSMNGLNGPYTYSQMLQFAGMPPGTPGVYPSLLGPNFNNLNASNNSVTYTYVNISYSIPVYDAATSSYSYDFSSVLWVGIPTIKYPTPNTQLSVTNTYYSDYQTLSAEFQVAAAKINSLRRVRRG